MLDALQPDRSGHGALAVGQYLNSLAPSSRRKMRESLDVIAALLTAGRCDALTLPWHQLRAAHTQAARARLLDATLPTADGRPRPRYAPATVNRHLAALRGVLKAAWRLDLLDEAAYKRAIDLKPAAGSRPPRGRQVPADELTALLTACAADLRPAGARDGALIALLYSSGLRRAEAAALRLEHYDPAAGTVLVVAGKGNRSRLCHPAPLALAWLERWLAGRGRAAGALFHPIAHHDHIQHHRHLTDGAIRTILHKRAAQAGIPVVAPHDLRRTFISDLLDAGNDLALAQSLAGHAAPTTTVRYDRRGEAARRRAAHSLRLVPPPGPTTSS